MERYILASACLKNINTKLECNALIINKIEEISYLPSPHNV